MPHLITRLADRLIQEIQDADEIWVAVALLNSGGLNFLLKNLKAGCKQNYLIGVDLPTDPVALKRLYGLKLNSNSRLYTDKKNFHPKVYLIRKNDAYCAFVGSANCTNGGLFNNVELTIHFTEQETCEELLNWFLEHFYASKELTEEFIKKYQNDYETRKERKNQEEEIVTIEKQALNHEHELILFERSRFIAILNTYRKSKDYQKVVKDRNQMIQQLRDTLDYPNFNTIDIDRYFLYGELGHLIAIAKPAIKRHIPELKRLLKWLCDENIDIALRYDEAFNGKYKVEGASKAFISKILVLHEPMLYYVKNQMTERALRKYGIQFPRGLTEGEKYKKTTSFLQKICQETGIQDLAVLDYYLYIEGNQENI